MRCNQGKGVSLCSLNLFYNYSTCLQYRCFLKRISITERIDIAELQECTKREKLYGAVPFTKALLY